MSYLYSIVAVAISTLISIFGNVQAYGNCEYAAFDDLCIEELPFTYEFELKGLYLMPNGCCLDYAAEVSGSDTPDWKVHSIHPAYHTAFEFGAFADIKENCTHLSFYWEHVYMNDRDHSHTSSQDKIGPLFEIDPKLVPYRSAQARVTHRFDEFSLQYGAPVKFCCLDTLLFIGVSSVRIKQHLTSRFFDKSGDTSRSIRSPVTYLAGGPQMGLNLTYNFWHNFWLNAEGTATLYVGRVKNRFSIVSQVPLMPGASIASNTQRVHTERKMCVVPAFKGKLGVSFNSCVSKRPFSIEIGYQVQVYIDAIQRMHIGSQCKQPPLDSSSTVLARTFHKTISNFALSGPYIALNFTF